MNIKLKNILNEAKGYYIKVSPRDAKKALSILDKMYRRKFDISGSDTYYFKDESMAYDATMDLVTQDIEVVDSNIEESVKINEFGPFGTSAAILTVIKMLYDWVKKNQKHRQKLKYFVNKL